MLTPENLPCRTELGIDGQRAVVFIYQEDQSNRVKQVLRQFQEESAEDYALRGCVLVAVRSRTLEGLEDRYPAIRFTTGLDDLTALRKAVGLADSLSPVLYGPFCYLVDPDGKVRASSDDVRANTIWGELTRALHAVTYKPGEQDSEQDEAVDFYEDEAKRQAAWSENAEWAQVLEENEELRQPTRAWWDGIMDAPTNDRFLSAQEQPLLPSAEAESDPAKQRILKEAPAWYAAKMQQIEAKAANEGPPLTLFEFLSESKNKVGAALKQADERKAFEAAVAATPTDEEINQLAQVSSLERTLETLRGDPSTPNEALKPLEEQIAEIRTSIERKQEKRQREAMASSSGASAAEAPGQTPAAAVVSEADISITLERAGLLALGLSRSGTSIESRRRLRLLRELEATVDELEESGYKDASVIGPLREQIEDAWSTAPPGARETVAKAAAMAEEEGKPLTAKELVEMLGERAREGLKDSVDRIDVDLAKWRLRIREKGEKKPKGKKTGDWNPFK